MRIARDAAPEIDRLVLSITREVGNRHGENLLRLATDRGLASIQLLPHLGDFLLGGLLTTEVATLRMRYMPTDRVLARLDELQEKSLIAQTGSGLEATTEMRPLLEAIAAAQADVSRRTWSNNGAAVDTVSRLSARVARAASDDHLVAVAHRALPPPSDEFLLLHHHLVTLRYVRQHDHATTWLGIGLTAPEMVMMTRLWHDEGADVERDVLGPLVKSGFVSGDPASLTAQGRSERDSIEEETNRLAQETFSVLDDTSSAGFLEALRSLPGKR